MAETWEAQRDELMHYMFDQGHNVGYCNCKNLVWVLYLCLDLDQLSLAGMWVRSWWRLERQTQTRTDI